MIYEVSDYLAAPESEKVAVTEWLDEHLPQHVARHCIRAKLVDEGVVQMMHWAHDGERLITHGDEIVVAVVRVTSAVPFPGFARTMREGRA